MEFKAKDLTLMITFAALYVVLSLVSLFPIIGAVGTFITLASIMAPLIGLILGPIMGAGAVSLGGFIGWSMTQTGAFGFLSFLPGAFTAFTAGLLADGKRVHSIALYAVLFSILAFYPPIGPVWLYPFYMWFQLVGLVVLASPLTSFAIDSTRNGAKLARLSLGVGVLCLVSTLLGQIAGNLMFELTYWPNIIPQVEFWRTGQWQFLTFIYPAERLVITAIATIVGTPMIKAIRANGLNSGANSRLAVTGYKN